MPTAEAAIADGDLLVAPGNFRAVVLGDATPQHQTPGYLGLNATTHSPGRLCFRQWDANDGHGRFCALTPDQEQRAIKDRCPVSEHPEVARALLTLALESAANPSRYDFGTSDAYRAEVGATVRRLLDALPN